MPESPRQDQPKWLLLLHQLPTRHSNARVKTWRRLQQIGAVPLRSSAYVLPNSQQAREDFEWMKKEIVAMGGQANVFTANAIDGRSNDEIVAMFRAAREADYKALLKDIAALERRSLKAAGANAHRESPFVRRTVWACRDRLAQIAAIDFFGSAARQDVEAPLAAFETRILGAASNAGGIHTPQSIDSREYRGRTWVMRPNPGIDRMASAWLIRNFIDRKAEFAFGEKPSKQQVPFDMYEGEFSHHGGLCTFEVLADKFGISDRAVSRIGEIVHDIDLKDSRFQPPEAATLGALVEGVRAGNDDDDTMLERGIDLFQALYKSMIAALPGKSRKGRNDRAKKNAK
jgi:hypothetical protein